jgi:hypothetical protein
LEHRKVIPNPILTIQFIEFTYCNDRFSPEKILAKTSKYQPLIDNIHENGWFIAPVIVITTGIRATTHIPSMALLHDKLKLPKSVIKQTCININNIAIHHAMSILLHKCKLEINQRLAILLDPP